MKMLPLDASDAHVLAAVREWVDLLVEERYEDACTFLFQEGDDPYAWTPELLKTLITNYGSLYLDDNEETFKVTSLEQARGNRTPRHDVNRIESGEPEGFVWFDLPINGEWSDLTAVLDLTIVDDMLVLELDSIEVM